MTEKEKNKRKTEDFKGLCSRLGLSCFFVKTLLSCLTNNWLFIIIYMDIQNM